MTPLTITQHLDCAEHIALLNRMGLRQPRPDRLLVHARALVMELRCPVCGDMFTRRRNTTRQRYCSTSCRRWAEKYGVPA